MTATVCSRFLMLAAAEPDRICFQVQQGLLDGTRPSFLPVTRQSFARSIEAVAQHLRQTGVEPGDRVLFCLPNSLSWVALDLACQAIGAVSVIVHPATPEPVLARIVAETSPRAIVRGGETSGSPGRHGGALVLALGEIERLTMERPGRQASCGQPLERLSVRDSGDLATVMYTSGTTGEPKGAELTHAGLLSNASSTGEALALAPDDVVPAVLSFSHSAGRTALLHTALCAGASVALFDSIDLDSDPQVVAAAGPTVLVVVPRVLDRLLHAWRDPGFQERGDPFARLRLVLVGGASLPLSSAGALGERGVAVFEAYGATEATCTITMNRLGSSRRGSVGRPLPGIELRIAEDGEVLCRGEPVMLGFHKDPERTAEVLDSRGWLHSGDLGFLDEHGFLHLVGRKKDVFLGSDGNHFCPAKIESMLESVPGIAEAIVYGDGRPFVSAFVVPRFERLRERSVEPHATCPRSPVCARSDQEMAACDRVRGGLMTGIDEQVNTALSPCERVKGLRVLPERFPEEVRGMTATAKVKVHRERFEERFTGQVREIYGEGTSDLAAARAAFRVPLAGLMEHVARFHERWSRPEPVGALDREPMTAPGNSFPEKPEAPLAILEKFERLVAAGSIRFSDRSYTAHMVSALPSLAIAAEALMAVLNQNQVSADASPVTTALELETVRWLADLVGYDPSVAGGIGTAGGSVANITALLAARNRALSGSSGAGVRLEDGGTIVVSKRMHYSFRRAAEILGLGGEQGLERIPVDSTNRISIDHLLRRLDELERAGRKVVALVAIAGTSETGNVDPIERMADIAEERDLWLHVDAAMGGAALASRRHRGRFSGIERAHSVTMDPHKWFYVPYHCAYVLFRDRALMRQLELSDPHFVVLRTGDADLGKWSIEGSRAANALKFWMVAQTIGRSGYAALVDRQLEMTADLASLLDRCEDLERLSVPELNILCFRFAPPHVRKILERLEAGSMEAAVANRWLDVVNMRIQSRLMASGRASLSRTTLESTVHGVPVVALRAVLFHPEIGREDLEALVSAVQKAGRDEVDRHGDFRGMHPVRDPESLFPVLWRPTFEPGSA